MITEPAPILLFCYKRLHHLECAIDALKKNDLANESELYIFSDGAKNKNDEPAVKNVRDYLKTIKGFRSIHVYESTINKGLASSIIDGVTKIFERYETVIVLEDDLVTSANFLSFMNQALQFYKNENIFSIAGFSFPIKGLSANSVYFTKRASSWGWATWKNRWQEVDWKVEDYPNLKKSVQMRRQFNKMGSDLSGMLEKRMNGELDSWAIRWCYHQFKIQSYTVYPSVSKVQNIGFGKEATNTRESGGRYSTVLDNSGITDFVFTKKIGVEEKIIKQFTRHYSIYRRVYFKFKNFFSFS